jgi:hypothetical protein
MRRNPRKRPTRPKQPIWLHTCSCAHCKGRAAVCMAAFMWVNQRDPDHALRHAREDLLHYFDRLPIEVQDALNQCDVNICSWCAEIWVKSYGTALAVELIRNANFVEDTQAVTSVDGFGDRNAWR